MSKFRTFGVICASFITSAAWAALPSVVTTPCTPDLREPVALTAAWPLAKHEERHEQVRSTIRSKAADLDACRVHFGELRNPVAIHVNEKGNLKVNADPTESAYCVARVIRRLDAGPYSCTFSQPYVWWGQQL